MTSKEQLQNSKLFFFLCHVWAQVLCSGKEAPQLYVCICMYVLLHVKRSYVLRVI